jgi:sarcosine oxidase subunit beta
MAASVSDIVVIGGGVIGAATGYYLAKFGKKVTLLEKDFLCAGSTGRCIGGIRQQFSSETSIRVMMESIELFKNMKEELGRDVEWYEGGYLMMAHSEQKKKDLLNAMQVQKKCGVKVDFLDTKECAKLVPVLNTEGLIGATWCRHDGQANPFLVVRGYSDGIQRFGGKVLLSKPVTAIDRKGGGFGVRTADGEMAGLDLPVVPERHEAVITEAIGKMFDPMLVDYRPDGCYFNQRRDTGQIIGCYTPDPRVDGHRKDTTFDFLKQMGRRMVRLVPALKPLCILRQWAGSYEMTPDGNPLTGETNVKGFWVSAGMCGHGFMFGPRLGQLLAQFMSTGKSDISLAEFQPHRKFGKAELLR